MKRRIAALVVLAASCAPELPNTPPGDFVVARFDPSAAIAVVPSPNDLATDPVTGLLSVPVPPEASAADRWFYGWLNTLNGFPAATGASVTFTQALDPATVTAATVRVLDLSANGAPVEVSRASVETPSPAAPGQVNVAAPAGGWVPGHRYAIAIIGGVNGVRGKSGAACVGSATWALARNEGALIDCPEGDLTSSACRLTTELIPSAITEDPARRLADQLATAKRLEALRRKYQPAIDAVVATGVLRSELALLWTFRVDDSASFVFDPAAAPPRAPTPNNLSIKQGLVSSTIDPLASPATQEWTRTWLNTLNGFPPATVAGADIAQQALEPSTITPRSVRVLALSGGPLTAPPTVSWSTALKRLTLTPAGGSWGAAKTVAVVVIGGDSGVKGVEGKRLVGSQVWALVRSAAPLVDCEVLGPSCRSFVKAAPITVNQAIALESLRRTYRPLLDQLEAEGVRRHDVAGAWVFSTTDQPELVFDPTSASRRLPTPNALLIDPATGLVAEPTPPGASPAHAELIADYLNTLDGFLVASIASAAIEGDVDPSSVTTNSVRVQVLSGAALVGAPTVRFDVAANRVEVTPPNGSWGKGRSIAVAVLGGPAGVRSSSGKPLAASQAFSFVRLSTSLVDSGCAVVTSTCRSVTALSDAQAIALEPIRRSLEPVFDSLESTGILREDVAGLWVFRTVDQAELTFDLDVMPFPNNHLLRGNTLPDGGVARGLLVVWPDGGAPGDDATPGVRLSLPLTPGASPARERLIAGLNLLDGFSTTAAMVSEDSAARAALDFGGLDAGSLTSAAGLVRLEGPAALLADGGVRGPDVRVCLNCASSPNDAGAVTQPEQLQWVPQAPLEEGSRYAAFVTTRVHDTRGRPVMASPTFALVRSRHPLVDAAGESTVPWVASAVAAQLEPVRKRFRGCLDSLEAAGHARPSLALAFCATTQRLTAPAQSMVAAASSTSVTPTPAWVVETTTTTRLALDAAQVPNAAIRAIVEAEVSLPDALTGAGGTVHPDAAQWQARPAHLTVVTPNGAAPPAGFPVVAFSHGLGRARGDVFFVANALAAAGFVVVALDAPLHGERADCRRASAPDDACADPAAQRCEPATGRCVARAPASALACSSVSPEVCFFAGQGRCLATGRCEGGAFAPSASIGGSGVPAISGLGFLEAGELTATRGHLQQAGTADLAHLVRILSATGPGSLSATLAAGVASPVDATTLHLLGHDVGAAGGVMFSAASAAPQRVSLNAVGADPLGAMLGGLGGQREGLVVASGSGSGTAEFDHFVVLARTALDAADPQNLVRPALASPSAARRVFVSSIEGDAVWPSPSTLLRAGLGAASAARLSWFRFGAHAGSAAAGGFPASWPGAARHRFLLEPGGPPGSTTVNPECDATNMAFNPATCATSVAQAQLGPFFSSGLTPANVPVTP